MSSTLEDKLVAEITELRALLHSKETELARLRQERQIMQEYGLNNQEICRYSRQLFMSQVGVQGQKKIKNGSVLIVGMGGLGCPAALYLVAAGIGSLGIVDYDDIEISNLHRQVLYTEANIGTPKVFAAAESLNRINSNVKIIPYKIQLNSDNALDIIKNYDVVLDATDNLATRFLLSDSCVLTKKPLVSGAVVRFEGHLSVFCYDSPCYRCIFAKPPQPEAVTNCGEGGVFGPVVGVIGVLQALEALKIILNLPDINKGSLLMLDATDSRFYNIELRPRSANCAICGDHPTIHSLIDYEEFCGVKINDKEPNLNLLQKNDRITVEDYNRNVIVASKPHLLIDVRSHEEYQICHLQNSINIPFTRLHWECNLKIIKDNVKKVRDGNCPVDLYCICRRGNDSQKAVQCLKTVLTEDTVKIKDIIGGIHAWNKIDARFPKY